MSLMQTYREAARASGRPLLMLLAEAARLRIGPRRIGLSEYIDFRLFENDLAWADKAAFGGLRIQHVLEEVLTDDYSRFLSLDKLSMYALLEGLRLPIPAIRATYGTLRPSVLTQLHTPQELATYLSEDRRLPIYLKRSFGSYGRGNVLVTGIAGDSVVLGNGRKEPLEAFCASLDNGRGLGWILQEPLQPHPHIVTLTQSTKISGLRLHTFLTSQGSRVTKGIFKINAGTRDSDNFEHGASGNLLAAVDIASGRVIRAIAGVGLGQRVNPTHSSSQTSLVGFEVPYWKEAVELVTDAHKAFPGFICPGWDIALCPDGPKVLEINSFGDIDLSQHAYRRSFLDEQFLALLDERGLLPLLHPSAARKKRSPTNGRLGLRKHHWEW